VGSGAWPVGTGHPCYGCTEQEIAFNMPLHSQAEVKHISPSAIHPPIVEERGKGISAGSAALLTGLGGVALGAAAVATMKLGKSESGEDN
jgi:hydrogenase small subunit